MNDDEHEKAVFNRLQGQGGCGGAEGVISLWRTWSPSAGRQTMIPTWRNQAVTALSQIRG
jgi:hypothetical protein